MDIQTFTVWDFVRVARRHTVHVHFFAEHVVDVDLAEEGACLGQIVDAHLLAEHGAGPDVGYLEGHGGAVAVFLLHEIADLVVDRDGETGIEIEAADEVVHGDDADLEVVNAQLIRLVMKEPWLMNRRINASVMPAPRTGVRGRSCSANSSSLLKTKDSVPPRQKVPVESALRLVRVPLVSL